MCGKRDSRQKSVVTGPVGDTVITHRDYRRETISQVKGLEILRALLDARMINHHLLSISVLGTITALQIHWCLGQSYKEGGLLSMSEHYSHFIDARL